MKISSYDLSKQGIVLRDMFDDVKEILNFGKYEIKTITDASPSWTETVKGVPVYSTADGTLTLFISDPNLTNGWAYVTLTEL